MIQFAGRGILLDIEGTTSSIHFVYDVMFPYVRRELDGFLRGHWNWPEVSEACELLARDAGHESLRAWGVPGSDDNGRRRLVRDEVIRLMDHDAKSTGLKQLQGLIWRAGFEQGELRAHVYDDVPEALQAWNKARRDVRIYSSGSIAAQKLFFAHTIVGDLLPRFGGHYDTTTGPKKEPASYAKIAADFAMAPADILFLSDIVGELDAARTAGLRTALCHRPGNATVPVGHGHPEIGSFNEVALV